MSQPGAASQGSDWRHAVEPYVGPNGRRASLQLATTLVPLAAAMWGIHMLLPRSVPLVFALTLLAAGLLVRTFVLMHDCAHGSFFASKRLNETVGLRQAC